MDNWTALMKRSNGCIRHTVVSFTSFPFTYSLCLTIFLGIDLQRTCTEEKKHQNVLPSIPWHWTPFLIYPCFSIFVKVTNFKKLVYIDRPRCSSQEFFRRKILLWNNVHEKLYKSLSAIIHCKFDLWFITQLVLGLANYFKTNDKSDFIVNIPWHCACKSLVLHFIG